MGRQITDARFFLDEHANNTWRARIETGTEPDDLLDEEYYRLLSAKVRPGDLIHAAWEDGSGFFILYVRAVPGPGRLVVHPIAGQMFPRADGSVHVSGELDVQDGVAVEYAGMQHLWRVRLVSDGTIIKSGLGEQREARRRRTLYVQTLNRRSAA